MKQQRLVLMTFLGAVMVLGGLSTQVQGQNPQAVDDARLLSAAKDPKNWLIFGHDYAIHGGQFYLV